MRRAPEPVQAYVAFWVNPDLVWLLVPAFCVVNDPFRPSAASKHHLARV